MTGLHLSLSNASGVNTNLVMFCDMLLLSVSYMKKKNPLVSERQLHHYPR